MSTQTLTGVQNNTPNLHLRLKVPQKAPKFIPSHAKVLQSGPQGVPRTSKVSQKGSKVIPEGHFGDHFWIMFSLKWCSRLHESTVLQKTLSGKYGRY